jgi:hypothetical protein
MRREALMRPDLLIQLLLGGSALICLILISFLMIALTLISPQ